MSREPFRVSKSLTEIWEIRDAIAQEVAHLPRREALSAIVKMAAEAGKSIDLPRHDPRMSVFLQNLEKVS
jgi:hypothetical protein